MATNETPAQEQQQTSTPDLAAQRLALRSTEAYTNREHPQHRDAVESMSKMYADEEALASITPPEPPAEPPVPTAIEARIKAANANKALWDKNAEGHEDARRELRSALEEAARIERGEQQKQDDVAEAAKGDRDQFGVERAELPHGLERGPDYDRHEGDALAFLAGSGAAPEDVRGLYGDFERASIAAFGEKLDSVTLDSLQRKWAPRIGPKTAARLRTWLEKEVYRS